MLKKKNAQGMSIKVIIAVIIALIVLIAVGVMFSGKFGDFRGGLKSVGDPTKTCESQSGQPTDGECGQNLISILSKDAGAEGKKCCITRSSATELPVKTSDAPTSSTGPEDTGQEDITVEIKEVGQGVSSSTTGRVTGAYFIQTEKYSKRFSSTYDLSFTFKDFPQGHYEVLLQYRKKNDEWKDFGVKSVLGTLPREGNTIRLRIIPATLFDESGVYQFRLIGAVNNPSTSSFGVESENAEIEFLIREECGKRCGDRVCAPYQACDVRYDYFDDGGFDEAVSYLCKLSSECGATCTTWEERYRHLNLYKIKDEPCSEFSNCDKFEKDDYGADIECGARHLCAGPCGDILPRCAAPSLMCGNVVGNGIQMKWSGENAAKYRLEWRKEGLSFDEPCANTNPAECGYTITYDLGIYPSGIGATEITAYALGLEKHQKYNFGVRAEEAATCQAPGEWSDIVTCNFDQPPIILSIDIPKLKDQGLIGPDYYLDIILKAIDDNGISTVKASLIREVISETVDKINFKYFDDIDTYYGEFYITDSGKYILAIQVEDISGKTTEKEIKFRVPFVEEDIGPPKIENVKITPEIGELGTVFNIQAQVTDDISLITWANAVSVSIIKDDISIASVDMVDDGSDGDLKAGDTIFTAILDSSIPLGINLANQDTLEGGNYQLTIHATDLFRKRSKYQTQFTIIDFEDPQEMPECHEVIEGQNNLFERRINVVFSGLNYHNREEFFEHMTHSIDFDGIYGGLLSQEPFKSNKERFNFLYVEPNLEDISLAGIDCYDKFGLCVDKANEYFSKCPTYIPIATALINTNFRSYAISGSKSFTSTTGSYYPKIVLHEFGHAFGILGDEYVEEKGKTYFGQSRFPSPNIFYGNKDICGSSSRNTNWGDVIGNGCGKVKELDCQPACVLKDDKMCLSQFEVGCFEGSFAYEFDSWRPTFNSIMRDQYKIPLHEFSGGFGIVNERILCDRIEAIAGSAGGICNDFT